MVFKLRSPSFLTSRYQAGVLAGGLLDCARLFCNGCGGPKGKLRGGAYFTSQEGIEPGLDRSNPGGNSSEVSGREARTKGCAQPAALRLSVSPTRSSSHTRMHYAPMGAGSYEKRRRAGACRD